MSMNIKRIIGIGALTAASAAIGAVLMNKFQQNKYGELVDKVVGLVGDVMKYDNEVLDLADAEHKKCTEISRKYKQLCKEYDEVQNEYNDMLDYYNED